MWTGHLHALALYGLAGLDELSKRGYEYPQHRITFEQYAATFPDTGMPWWMGHKEFHLSHQSNLLRKNKDHYGQFFGDISDELPYLWPCNETKTFKLKK